MPVIFQSFENYPDDEQFSIDLDKIYGETLNQTLSGLCQSPDTHLFCGKFNGRWIASALITETNTSKLITIRYFCVREATRRRGVGTQLMEEIIKKEYLDINDDKNSHVSLVAQITQGHSIDDEVAKAFLLALQFKPENSPSSESSNFTYQP